QSRISRAFQIFDTIEKGIDVAIILDCFHIGHSKPLISNTKPPNKTGSLPNRQPKWLTCFHCHNSDRK
ncbi:MAG: hypothetical protein ACI875_000416, partial [Planctomycetota bacterium]